jgi:hypothetical protein
MDDLLKIGLCGYAEPTDAGFIECRASGKRLTVQTPFGLSSIVRCRKHSDWVEAEHIDGQMNTQEG